MTRSFQAALTACMLVCVAAPAQAQELTAAGTFTHFSRGGALTGYELGVRWGDPGVFVAWEDIRGSDPARMRVWCDALQSSVACEELLVASERRVRNVVLGYAVPVISRAGWSASALPQLRWSYAQSHVRTDFGRDTEFDGGQLRLGAGAELSGRPFGQDRVRLLLGGALTTGLTDAPCADCSEPRWVNSPVSATLNAGLAISLK